MAPSSSNQPIQEFTLDAALAALGLSQEQFIDLCIMCGCDYASNIRGIGPVRALEFIRKHGCLEKVGRGGRAAAGRVLRVCAAALPPAGARSQGARDSWRARWG